MLSFPSTQNRPFGGYTSPGVTVSTSSISSVYSRQLCSNVVSPRHLPPVVKAHIVWPGSLKNGRIGGGLGIFQVGAAEMCEGKMGLYDFWTRMDGLLAMSVFPRADGVQP